MFDLLKQTMHPFSDTSEESNDDDDNDNDNDNDNDDDDDSNNECLYD